MMHIKKRPAHVNFFFGQENSRVRASLAQYGARLSRHTIWQMQAIPATMIKKEIQHLYGATAGRSAATVLQLHRQFFTGDAVTDVSAERPLWVAWQDAQPVGYALAEVDIDHVGHLLYVAVAPAAQTSGVGPSTHGGCLAGHAN
jgi:ribosomal protein S18 acetylase RimI-like enzyme